MVIFDITKRTQEIAVLEARAADPRFWDDASEAQKLMQALSRVKEDVAPWHDIDRRLNDAETLLELAQSEDGGEAFTPEIETELKAAAKGLDTLEIATLLSGPHDSASAYLELKPGAGGTDACDWAAMMLRMYLRWAEDAGYKAEIKDEQPGDVAGLSSATVLIEGKNAYGFLRSEHGVHRLVRISPFNATGKRQTSFVGVEVMPVIENDSEIVISPDDIQIDVYRASGAGGQHVNKTSSAVRITHKPTGIVVQCQNERSQLQNKEVALSVLKSRLAERAAREDEAKLAAIRGEQRAIEWGSQIRSYVFQPYTLVKDARSGVEIGDVQRVMNGGLEPLMTGYLRYRADGQKPGGAFEDGESNND